MPESEANVYYIVLRAVPDELVMKVLKLRMTELDCLAHGWVLHGFPKTAAQAETMERAGLTPDR